MGTNCKSGELSNPQKKLVTSRLISTKHDRVSRRRGGKGMYQSKVKNSTKRGTFSITLLLE